MPSIFEKLNQIKSILLDQTPEATQRAVKKAKRQKKEVTSPKRPEQKHEEAKDLTPPFQPAPDPQKPEEAPSVKSEVKLRKKKLPETKPLEPWIFRKENDLLLSSSVSYFPLPLKQPKKVQNVYPKYIRQTKYWDFVIEPSQDFGSPFGQDQLILLAISHIVRLSSSRKVEIKSLRQVLVSLGLDTGGRQYRRFKESIQRLFRAQFYIFEKDSQEKGLKASLFDVIHISGLTEDYKKDDGCFVMISEWFFNEIMRKEIPYDLEVLRRLSGNPGAMRLYLKMAPKCYNMMTSNQKLSVVNLDELMYEIGSEKYSSVRKQRQIFKNWLGELKQVLQDTGQGEIPLKFTDKDTVHFFPKKLVPGEKAVSKKLIENKIQTKFNSKSPPLTKEFEVDWVLEKEIEAFDAHQIPALTDKASKYRAKKKDYEKSIHPR